MKPDDDQLRADARANRDRILDVARAALEDDPQVSLNAIAKTAGVGAGTLYRHFPNREALILAVYRKEIEGLAAIVPSLLAKHPPLTAFRKWCDRLADLGRVKHGVADVLHSAKIGDGLDDIYGPVIAGVRTLMAACERAGAIRPGTDAEDFLMLFGFTWRIAPAPAGQARVKRLLVLLFRGLGAELDD